MAVLMIIQLKHHTEYLLLNESFCASAVKVIAVKEIRIVDSSRITKEKSILALLSIHAKL